MLLLATLRILLLATLKGNKYQLIKMDLRIDHGECYETVIERFFGVELIDFIIFPDNICVGCADKLKEFCDLENTFRKGLHSTCSSFH
jgi:hypothetical protein